jgi:hypothetical protein
MQQFTVPQFIDVEDKIIGPLTTRQFLIMLFCAVLIGACYKFFDFTLFVTMGIFIFMVCGVFAFFKINGMPFHFFVLNFFQTIGRPGLRIWENSIGKAFAKEEQEETVAIEKIPQKAPLDYTSSRLSELSLIVDTRGAYRGEEKN